MDPQQIAVPIIHAGEGLYIVIGGFVEVDTRDEKAVVVTYAGGSQRVLSESQSETTMIALGIKERRVVPATFGR
jgi:hypothetical protein